MLDARATSAAPWGQYCGRCSSTSPSVPLTVGWCAPSAVCRWYQAAEKDLGVKNMSLCLCTVPSQPREPTVSWAASKATWPAGQGRWSCPSALCWWDLMWSAVSRRGAPSTGETCWSTSREGPQKMIWRMEHCPARTGWELWLCLEERRLQWDLISAFQYFKEGYKKVFFTIRELRHWHRLPREVGDVPSLETFKVRLDRALST